MLLLTCPAQGDLLSAAMPSIAQHFEPPEFKPLPDISPIDLVQDISWFRAQSWIANLPALRGMV